MPMTGDTGTLDYAQSVGSTLYFPVTEFVLTAGTPALEVVDGLHHGMLFDTTTSETIALSFVAPPNWSTVDITYYHYNPTTGTGGVVIGYYMADIVADAVLTAETPTVIADITVTAVATADVLKITAGGTGVAVTSGGYNAFHVGRLPVDAADTLAADYALLGVALTRAS